MPGSTQTRNAGFQQFLTLSCGDVTGLDVSLCGGGGKKERLEEKGRVAAMPAGGRTAAEVIRIIPTGQHRTTRVRRREGGGKDGRFPTSESELDDHVADL